MDTAVFTIVARNYLPFAKTLGDSIKATNDNVDFVIFLVDPVSESIVAANEKHKIVETSNLGIKHYLQMAFKYDITEFSTALKPFLFNYLIRSGYEKVLYLDPDIYVYSSLVRITEALDKYSVVLSPHICCINNGSEKGATSEEDLLFCGVFNLGFIGIKNNLDGRSVVEWWMEKEFDKGFCDRSLSLFVDQKWMNFIPCFLGDRLLVSRDPGVNMAVWNLHERRLLSEENGLRVIDSNDNTSPLCFFHFSGFNPIDPSRISSKHPSASFEKYPELETIFNAYSKKLIENGISASMKLPYLYNYFKNGKDILLLQRRIFNSLTSLGHEYIDPFEIGDGTFYQFLQKNALLQKGASVNSDKIGMKDMEKYEGKIKLINKFMLLLCRILGIQRYSLLLRFLHDSTSKNKQANMLAQIGMRN